MLLIFFGVALFAALTNLNEVADFFRILAGILSPVVSGLLLAFVLSVPMLGIARRLTAHFPKMKEKTVDALSLTLTMLCVAVLVFLLCVLAIPQLAASVRSIAVLVRENWPDWVALLSSYGVDTTELTKLAASFDWTTAVEKLFTGAGAVIGSVVDLASSTVSVTVNAVFAIVIMFYVLLGRRELSKQSRGFLYAYCKEMTANRICRIAKLTHDTYAKFFSGQCIEVLILGTLIFLAFSVFRIPYAALTAVLTAVLAFIPYVGAFSSCAIGALLTLLAEPEKTILCIIVYQAVQFVENQFIYPHVVGGSVGLAPIWTLVAALLGGQLFGLVGIIFFIPLTAVIYQLIGQGTDRRLAAKGRSTADGGKREPEGPSQEAEKG